MRTNSLAGFCVGTLALLAMLFGPCQRAYGQNQARFVHEREVGARYGDGTLPRWSGSVLVGRERSQSKTPVLYVADRDGRREEIDLELPGASLISLRDAVGGFDGAIAAAGYAESSDQRGGAFIIWISADRTRRTVIRTSPYFVQVATIAWDGTIWTIGGIADDSDRAHAKTDILKRFSTSGKELTSLTVRARARSDISPDAGSLSYLVASHDRVGWLTNGGEYIEFALDGKEVARFNAPPNFDIYRTSGAALDRENSLVLGKTESGRLALLTLDRSTCTWQPASIALPNTQRWARVLGFDGMTLITTGQVGGMRRFVRSREEQTAK